MVKSNLKKGIIMENEAILKVRVQKKALRITTDEVGKPAKSQQSLRDGLALLVRHTAINLCQHSGAITAPPGVVGEAYGSQKTAVDTGAFLDQLYNFVKAMVDCPNKIIPPAKGDSLVDYQLKLNASFDRSKMLDPQSESIIFDYKEARPAFYDSADLGIKISMPLLKYGVSVESSSPVCLFISKKKIPQGHFKDMLMNYFPIIGEISIIDEVPEMFKHKYSKDDYQNKIANQSAAEAFATSALLYEMWGLISQIS